MSFVDFLEQLYEVEKSRLVLEMEDNVKKIRLEHINDIVEGIINKVVSQHSDLIQDAINDEHKYKLLESAVLKIIDEEKIVVPELSRQELIKKVMDEIFGYGILQKYIEDPEVNDIMVNKYDVIYIRKGFEDIKVPEKFKDEEAYEQFLFRVAAMCGQKLNDTNPIVDGTDKRFGLRINITYRPINYISPMLVIRKTKQFISLDTILQQGNISKAMYDTFLLLAKIGCRIMFAGQIEAGKTTLMSAFLNLIDKRMVIMEDTPELIVNKPNVIFQRTVTSKFLNKKQSEEMEVTLADLVRNFRRSNAQMPVVGEVRGIEAVELLDIFNTGFLWGACSIHANSSQDVINQLIYQIKSSGKVGVNKNEIEEYISRTLDVIVYMEKRKVVEITEVCFNEEKRKLELRPIHRFVIERETEQELQGYFVDFVNKFSSKMADRARRAGIGRESVVYQTFFES